MYVIQKGIKPWRFIIQGNIKNPLEKALQKLASTLHKLTRSYIPTLATIDCGV